MHLESELIGDKSTVESATGAGTTIRVSWPYDEGEKRNGRPPLPKPTNTRASKTKYISIWRYAVGYPEPFHVQNILTFPHFRQ